MKTTHLPSAGARRDSLLTVFGLALVVALFCFLVYVPGRKMAKSLQREITAAEKAIRDVPQRVAELELLQQEARLCREYLEQTETLMPADADLHTVIRRVADLAENCGLTVTRLEPLPKVAHRSYQALPFRVSFRGRFRGVAVFLRGLEADERMFTIEDFSITGEDKRLGRRVHADMQFAVYIRRRESTGSADNNASSSHLRADTKS